MTVHEFCSLADTQIQIHGHDHGYTATFEDWEGMFDDPRLWPHLDRLEGGGTWFAGRGSTPNDALNDFLSQIVGKKLAFKKNYEKKRRYIDMPAKLTIS